MDVWMYEDGEEGDEGDEGEDGDDADDDDKDDTDNDDDHQLMDMVPIRRDPQPHEHTVRGQKQLSSGVCEKKYHPPGYVVKPPATAELNVEVRTSTHRSSRVRERGMSVHITTLNQGVAGPEHHDVDCT
eukprot:10390369-Karenia_brevis.AAC.1